MKEIPDVTTYGVKGVHSAGCVKGSPIHPGKPGAMRKSGHAHNCKEDSYYRHICFKAYSIERVRPSLFWHEVAHIHRPSWTEKQCNKWAWKKAREKTGG